MRRPLSGCVQRADVVGHGRIDTRGVAWIEARNRAEKERGVLVPMGEHPTLIEARSERDHAVARYAPVGWLDADDARQSAAGWRIEPPVSVPVAAGTRRAATAAAEPPEDPPGTRVGSHGLRTGP